MGKLFVLVAIGLLAFGGYYLHSQMEISDRERAFDTSLRQMRQDLLKLYRRAKREDIDPILRKKASEHHLTVNSLQIMLEPMNETSMKKLNSVTRAAINIAKKMKRRAPSCVISWQIDVSTKVGLFSSQWQKKGAIYFDDMEAGACQ